jgi:predicted MarR family transcription regulator
MSASQTRTAVATVEEFLRRFAATRRFDGWFASAKAAAVLRGAATSDPTVAHIVARWDRFQSTHGAL